MKKSPVCEKKTKIAHNFFVTKAADLKTICLKSPWKMHEETCVTVWDLFKTKKYFFSFFSTLHIKVISLIFFFYELALKHWAMIMHFNPIPIL